MICCSADLPSNLLLLPLELRLQIYHFALPSHFHVRLQAAGLLLSECLGPSHPTKDGNVDEFEADGFSTFLDHPTSVIGRATTRTHWRCEMAAMSDIPEGISWLKTLCICKQIRNEIVRMLQRTATFHISDLEIIRYCSKHAADFVKDPSLCIALFQHASHVAISPKFSPVMYNALEQTNYVAALNPELDAMVNNWRMIGSDLAGMPNITKVALWFDHDEPFRWAHVNERALLSPLATLLCDKRIEFNISMPDLHPDDGDADRHFTSVATTPFNLVRRPRKWQDQDHFCNDTSSISRERDFSLILEMWEYLAEFSQLDMSRSKLEEYERDDWKFGMEGLAAEFRDSLNLGMYVSYSI